MKYIFSVLLSSLPLTAQEWRIYQYSNKYSISIPPTLELRKEDDIYTQAVRKILGQQIVYQILSDNKAELKGLTAQDRADWEKQYAADIQGLEPEQAERLYRNVKFREKFGNRPDYETLKRYTPKQRDSLYNEAYEKKYPERIIFQQAGLSINKPEYKSRYCRILIDHYTSEEGSYYPYSTDRVDFDISYYQGILKSAESELQNFGAQILDVMRADTCTINDCLATKVIYKRTGYNGESPVIVAIYMIFNYTECIRLTYSFREIEQEVWLNDLIKTRDSFQWMNLNLKQKTVDVMDTTKDEAIREGMEVGISTVCKIMLEVIFGCCFLIFVIKSRRKKNTKGIINTFTADDTQINLRNTIIDRLPTETTTIHKTKHEDVKNRIWKIVKKLLLTTTIIVSSCVICTLMGNYGYYINCYFYFPFYFVVTTYYIYLIWRRQEVHSEDIVFYPLLKKIGIYSNISDSYTLRKKLLVSVIPLSLATILTSLLVVSISSLAPEEDEVSIGSILLGLPVLAWGVFFVYVYGRKWLNNAQKI